eukprot:scaffold2188_cov102-Isochrysis_galbana.AAC.10
MLDNPTHSAAATLRPNRYLPQSASKRKGAANARTFGDRTSSNLGSHDPIPIPGCCRARTAE